MEDLQKKVDENRGNLGLLEQALKAQPENEQLLEAKSQLLDVIRLAEELLAAKRAALEPVKKRKAEALNESSNGWKVGDKCEAKWSEDETWYKATILQIVRVDERETVTVKFDEYGNRDTIPIADVRAPQNLPERPEQAMRKTDKVLEVPDALRVTAEDDAETRATKRRKIKQIKSKNRLLKLEQSSNNKVGAWMKFQKKNKKVYKKDSMFASGDSVDSKVGVVGSGKGVTEIAEFKAPVVKPKKLSLPL